jgi:hypothetical protein
MRRRLFFAATTLMATLHVWRTRNTGQMGRDPKIEMHQDV